MGATQDPHPHRLILQNPNFANKVTCVAAWNGSASLGDPSKVVVNGKKASDPMIGIGSCSSTA